MTADFCSNRDQITPATWLEVVRQNPVIAVIRAHQYELAWQMAQAVAVGGLRLIEITWNSDRPTQLIEQLRQDLPGCVIGAGTLLTRAEVEAAIAAGAQFLFSPHVNPVLIEAALAHDRPLIPGAFSPTEIVTAWQAGAPCVKVFPIQALGGVAYLQALRGPLGHIPLIPTGGVTIENAPEFLAAGAIAVGLSGSLFPASMLRSGDWQGITTLAQKVLQQMLRGD